MVWGHLMEEKKYSVLVMVSSCLCLWIEQVTSDLLCDSGNTQWQHTVATHSGNTQWQHTVATHSGYTQWQHTVATHSGYTQWLHTVATHSGYTQWQHTVATHSGNTQWQHTVATHSGYTQWQHTVATHSGNTQWLHTVASHSDYTQSMFTPRCPLSTLPYWIVNKQPIFHFHLTPNCCGMQTGIWHTSSWNYTTMVSYNDDTRQSSTAPPAPQNTKADNYCQLSRANQVVLFQPRTRHNRMKECFCNNVMISQRKMCSCESKDSPWTPPEALPSTGWQQAGSDKTSPLIDWEKMYGNLESQRRVTLVPVWNEMMKLLTGPSKPSRSQLCKMYCCV